jgi:beta-glucanase (GH16 family)
MHHHSAIACRCVAGLGAAALGALVACGSSSQPPGGGAAQKDNGGTAGADTGTSEIDASGAATPDASGTSPGDEDSGVDQDGTTVSADSGVSRDGAATGTDGGSPVAPSQVPSGWTLALDDEFNGTTLGPDWSVGTNLGTFVDDGITYWKPYQSEEAEYLTASMVAVQDSNLILSTEASSPISGPYGTKSFIAGYVTSYGKFAFQYGYIEFRVEMPDVAAGSDTGLWPALWLLNSTYANSDEIDVLESYGADQTAIQMTAQPSNSVDATVTPGYHVLAVLHQASTIAFYVDNMLVKSFDQSMSSEMAILMGLQLGSSAFGWLPGPTPSDWPGGINGSMTADLKIDWVHVWTPP